MGHRKKETLPAAVIPVRSSHDQIIKNTAPPPAGEKVGGRKEFRAALKRILGAVLDLPRLLPRGRRQFKLPRRIGLNRSGQMECASARGEFFTLQYEDLRRPLKKIPKAGRKGKFAVSVDLVTDSGDVVSLPEAFLASARRDGPCYAEVLVVVDKAKKFDPDQLPKRLPSGGGFKRLAA